MPVEIFMSGPPECPLCYDKMRETITPRGIIYVCTKDTCMISVAKNDPACGRWREREENAPDCPICGHKMRWFFRAGDGYKKVQCPHCTSKGRTVQVQTGKVQDMGPQDANAWSIDPEEL